MGQASSGLWQVQPYEQALQAILRKVLTMQNPQKKRLLRIVKH